MEFTHRIREDKIIGILFDGTIQSALRIARIFGSDEDFLYELRNSRGTMRVRGHAIGRGEYVIINSNFSIDTMAQDDFDKAYIDIRILADATSVDKIMKEFDE